MTESQILGLVDQKVPNTSQYENVMPQAEIVEPVAPQDPNKWACNTCTFENTINDWTDINESLCEMCQEQNNLILELIQQKKDQKQSTNVSPGQVKYDSDQFMTWVNNNKKSVT